MPDGPPHPTDRVLAGRYRLLRTLAVGGMATVWEGEDVVLSRRVAVKVPHPHLAADPAYEARFRREAVAAARLSHPGIVATYDTGRDDDTAPPTSFIVMELVPGRTLRDVVAEGPVDPPTAIALVTQVAEALDVAHRAGLIHRDVKPANLLVVDSGGPVPRIKVADFGVARAQEALDRELTSGEATKEGFVVGTARYLAPEQVAARALDPRTDVYALGCVLHELLVGVPPFVRETDLGTALAHLQEPPPPLPPTVPAALAEVVRACLAKDPDDRPPSAADLRDRLHRAGSSAAAAATRLVPLADAPTALLQAPVVPPAPTPVEPQAAERPRPGRPRRAGRSVVPLVLVLLLVGTSVALGALALDRLDGGRSVIRGEAGGTTVPASTALRVANVLSFDPAGDGREHDDDLPLLVDGDPDTTWRTERYQGPLQRVKPGVGVVLRLQTAAPISQVELTTATQGYAVQVHLAAGPGKRLGDWGDPVASERGADRTTTLRFDPHEAGAVLLWFTDLGPGFVLEAGEVVVR